MNFEEHEKLLNGSIFTAFCCTVNDFHFRFLSMIKNSVRILDSIPLKFVHVLWAVKLDQGCQFQALNIFKHLNFLSLSEACSGFHRFIIHLPNFSTNSFVTPFICFYIYYIFVCNSFHPFILILLLFVTLILNFDILHFLWNQRYIPNIFQFDTILGRGHYGPDWFQQPWRCW